MSWPEVDAWIRAQVPALHATFRPGASAADIAAAEEVIGAPLPADLVAWWRVFGGADQDSTGSSILPPYYDPHTISQSLKVREMMIGIRREFPSVDAEDVDDYEAEMLAEPAGSECQELWLPLFVPIAGDGSGNDLFVDLRGGPLHGCVMVFDKVSGADDEPLWDNVTAMLDEVARSLRGEGEHTPVIDGDRFYWE